MIPIEFPEQNVVFAKDQPEYLPLPAFKAETGEVISCWKLSDEEVEEVEEVKKTGVIWINTHTFNQPLQPIFITGIKSEVLIVPDNLPVKCKADGCENTSSQGSPDYCPDHNDLNNK